MIDLTGKVVLITGAARGIGRGCAVELARCGADIVINDCAHADEAAAVAAEVEQLGRRALVVMADVADRAAVDRMVATAVAELGRLDIVVANAARTRRRPFLELRREDLEETWAVTLWGVFHTCQAGARQLVQQGQGGKIILISSLLAWIPFANSLPYNAAKAAIEQMGRTIATELLPHRINVNLIEPGWIDTPGERAFLTEEQLREEAAKLPWGRLGRPDEIGKAVAFLASSAADYITGACLRVDGGYWLPRQPVPLHRE